ncbi:tetratricopeptide repeat (TPR)-like superfamily protein [Actinidia rufa]|uniref:Tetratricopeptide repeat (TPR)-like superfamily protein n=1 Tax=Actinidia rufa TaxID=165716 RepID=A0A7J0H3K2_9ERIC|nr:tetratricopeptide repeat (TPR)-like superfamily protein [Actinidia rufa]
MGLVEEAYWVYRNIGELPAVQTCHALLDGVVKMGNMPKAHKIFDEMVERGTKPTVVIYTTLIRGLSREGKMSEAERNATPCSLNYDNIMRFLKNFPSVQTKLAKSFAITKPSNVHSQSNYRSPRRNQILRNYLKSNSTTKVLLLFRNLLRKSISSIDSFSLLFVTKACTQKSLAIEGKQMHALVIKLGSEAIIFLQTSLMELYSAAGHIDDAHQVFDEIPTKNVVCWTALISGYVNNKKPNKALQMFRQMQMDDVEPDQVTLTVALSACVDLGALDMGEWIHAYINRRKRTRKGLAEEALRLFAAMKGENKSKMVKKRSCDSRSGLISPNDVTFIGVLMACSHAQMVEEGKRHFQSMIDDYGLKPRVSHFGCMVDLLCRGGLLEEAYDLIMDMPVRPNAVVWRTLLSACGIQGNIDLAAEARARLLELEVSHVGDDVIMSNIYAAKGMWDEKMVVREKINQRRSPGCSSIEVGSQINEFVTADNDHPLRREINEVLWHLTKTLKAHGYAPGLSNPTEY